MRWIGLALALVLVGGATGYGVGLLRHEDPAQATRARPVPAQSPSIPVLPTPPFAPDIDYPMLRTGLDYTRRLFGSPPYFQWSYDAPAGWVMTIVDRDELRWRPPDEPVVGGFSMRVKLVNENRTTEEMVEQKKAAFLLAYDDVVVLEEDEDSISFSYRDPEARTQRFNRFFWTTRPGSTEATFEMSVVGRKVDVPGLTDLFEHVAASIRKVEG
ncbi:hypothetical protein JCM10369A_07800 [Nocardioides pyridinolyticus]